MIKQIPIKDALGEKLAHAITAIRHDELKDVARNVSLVMKRKPFEREAAIARNTRIRTALLAKVCSRCERRRFASGKP